MTPTTRLRTLAGMLARRNMDDAAEQLLDIADEIDGADGAVFVAIRMGLVSGVVALPRARGLPATLDDERPEYRPCDVEGG